jgi:hypothetical protein
MTRDVSQPELPLLLVPSGPPPPGWSRTVPNAPVCPDVELHTLSPSDYVSWMEWSQRMLRRGYVPVRCSGCARFAIWHKRLRPNGRRRLRRRAQSAAS